MEYTYSLQKLAAYQPRKTKKSKETFDAGLTLLNRGGFSGKGEEVWDGIEKLALAAIDEGNLEVADRCVKLLVNKFRGSPRVDCLEGIRMEATADPELVLVFYDQLLDADSSNFAIWRRKASVLRRVGKIEQAVEELSAMLDTFYTEPDGWLELADMYASCQQYTYALQSLSHALLLSPQNPSYFLQYAETAYLAEDVPLALKTFLHVVDMTDDDDGDLAPSDAIPTGITLRAWFGAKLCTRKLISEPRSASSSASQTAAPNTANLSLLEDLATERLRTAYLNVKNESPPTVEADFIAAVSTLVK
ncbi:hypothetical protein V8D89_000078 [Ganoderma adspersum]